MSNMDLTTWEKRLLSVIRDKAPREHKKLVRQAGNLLRKNVRNATPRGSLKSQPKWVKGTKKEHKPGDLRRSYRVRVKGDTATVYTNKFYAKMVEEGHELVMVIGRYKKGRRTYRIKKSLGFVPGKFYFKKGFEKTEKELPELLKDFVHRMGRELGMDVSR